jgi:hypothetical protein
MKSQIEDLKGLRRGTCASPAAGHWRSISCHAMANSALAIRSSPSTSRSSTTSRRGGARGYEVDLVLVFRRRSFPIPAADDARAAPRRSHVDRSSVASRRSQAANAPTILLPCPARPRRPATARPSVGAQRSHFKLAAESNRSACAGSIHANLISFQIRISTIPENNARSGGARHRRSRRRANLVFGQLRTQSSDPAAVFAEKLARVLRLCSDAGNYVSHWHGLNVDARGIERGSKQTTK